MAILLRGRSRCHLCNAVIEAEDEAQLFPPALFATDSAFGRLNDSAVHRQCLDARPDGDLALQILDEYLRDL
ncbi:hypothetical protein [Aeromicrobium sp. CnD17-E]|uniref:hypothetical protein n=1 Tax=Aeromicrobium sp. CnD17-E TaxID=2954487 RepID=UPI0020973924|nr:hypothetical protein [Aeromicrobium sp. CnD17-E]MCO7239520.1 hypothetical protein [Aeromicrobium sp. CnD17-E]